MAAPDKPVFVIDLDGTILTRTLLDGVRLYFGSSGNVGVPYRDVSQVIAGLSDKYHIVALTARAEAGRANTVKWLARHGLGSVELHHSPHLNLHERSRRHYKTARLAQLAKEGYRLVWGAGDRLSDFSAYIANGMYPLVVLRPSQALRLRKIGQLATRHGLTEHDYRVFIERPDSPAWKGIVEFVGRNIH